MNNESAKGIEKTSTCDICHFTTNYGDDVLSFGDWMEKQSITVHYFCLLLSTDLPQRGTDKGGILGFLIRDIRKEIGAAAERNCCFCSKPHASIACVTCRKFFHLSCGMDAVGCVFRFSGDFASYCEKCAPLDDYQRQIQEQPPRNVPCSICLKKIPLVVLSRVVYCNHCRKSFAHRICIQRYALSSGYYLRCIWCRSAEFRDWVRLQGVFVPDREASWEVDRNAFSDHYRGHMRCDIEPCSCPKGRDYQRPPWSIIRCKLCASFGAHLKCAKIGPKDNAAAKDYKCPTCLLIESKTSKGKTSGDSNSSIYFVKQRPQNPLSSPNCEGQLSDDASVSSNSVVTVIEAPSKVKIPAVHATVDKSPSENQNKEVFDACPTNDQDLEKNEEVAPSMAAQNNFNGQADVVLENHAIAEEGRVIKANDKKAVFPRPLQLKSSYKYSQKPDYFFLEVYEMDASENNCIGTIVLRLSITDSRLKDKSVAAFEQLELTEADVVARNNDRGVYAQLDQIMAEELEKLKST